MTTAAEMDRQKRWYAAVHTDNLTRRTEAVIRLADQEQKELRAELERLREERAAIDLLDWPGEAHRLQAALSFARGTIDDLSLEVTLLEEALDAAREDHA